jgi:hypothetical protein
VLQQRSERKKRTIKIMAIKFLSAKQDREGGAYDCIVQNMDDENSKPFPATVSEKDYTFLTFLSELIFEKGYDEKALEKLTELYQEA